MKNQKTIFICLILLASFSIKAQISVSAKMNPPQWGPAGHTDVRYYYLPDLETYYDLQTSKFIYYRGGTWVHRSQLPLMYNNYDLYSGYKVVITDYRGNKPFGHFKNHKMKYAKGYRGPAQKTIGNKPGKNSSTPNIKPHNPSNKKASPDNNNTRQNKNINKGHNNKNKDMSKGSSSGKGKK